MKFIAITFLVLLSVAIGYGKLWVIASVTSSCFKTFSDECDVTYVVDNKLNLKGDLFCPAKKKV